MSQITFDAGPPTRRARLVDLLADIGARTALIADPRNIFYLTGYLPGPRSPAFLLLRAGAESLLVAGAGEAAPRDLQLTPYEDYSIERVVDRRGAAADALLCAAAQFGLARDAPVAAELHALPAFARAALGSPEPRDLTPLLRSLRAIKDAQEQAAIRRAVMVTAAGHRAARQAAAGASELEVYAAILRACVLEAGEPIAFDGDFVSGERTWQVGGPPTNRLLRDGDLFICDLFPTVSSYWADTTRTFVVGNPSGRQRDLYMQLHDAVLSALERGRAALRPGVRACDVYHEVRAALAQAGHADHFPHHAGHGIGLEPHESPMLIPGDDTELRPGMIVTLEPGIYVEGIGGVRLEDNYIITEDDAQVLPNYLLGL